MASTPPPGSASEYCIVSIDAAATTVQYPKPEVIMRSETTDTKLSEYISKYLPFENIVKYCSDPICVKINLNGQNCPRFVSCDETKYYLLERTLTCTE